MSPSEYRKVSRVPPFTETTAAVLGHTVRFSNTEGFLHSVDIAPELGRVERLFFEYHSIPGKPQRLGDLLGIVTQAGFRYVINGAHGPRLPFVERADHGFDLQLNVSCFRA